jgi:hypothetical protein
MSILLINELTAISPFRGEPLVVPLLPDLPDSVKTRKNPIETIVSKTDCAAAKSKSPFNLAA